MILYPAHVSHDCVVFVSDSDTLVIDVFGSNLILMGLTVMQ